MAQTIKLKRSSVSGNVPGTSQLELGELAINTHDGKVFIKKDDGTASIVEVGLSTPTASVYSKYSYTATASQTTFSGTDDNSNSLSYYPGYAEVYLNGVKLLDTTEYTATNGSSIVLAAGASANDVLEVIAMGSGSLEQLIVTRGFDSFIYTATASQTTFSGTDDNSNSLSYTANQIQVFLNGVLLDPSDYTASNGTSVVISSGTAANDIVTILAYNVDSLDSIGDLSVTGTVTADGLSLGDNDKATFGNSNDLEIYHDGSNSYISDVGTGSLRILAQDFRIRTADNTGQIITGIDGGQVNLYHNNDLKLATTATGIDVTGTAVTDGLTVDGDISLTGGSDLQSDGTLNIKADQDGSGAGVLRLTTNAKTRQKIDNNGDISFYEDTGTTPKFFWDASAESLGIGTTSPDYALHVYKTGSLDHISVDGPAGINRNLNFSTAGSTRWNIYANATAEGGSNSGSNLTIAKYTDAGVYNGVALFIERSSGNVGIGTTSPLKTLDIAGQVRIDANSDHIGLVETATGKRFDLATESSSFTISDGSTERLRIDSSGTVLIGTDSSAHVASVIIADPIAASIALTDTGAAADLKTRRIYTANQDLWIQTRNDDGSLKNNDVFIGGDGLVGINTTSPARRLSVNSGGIQIAAVFESTSTNTSRISLVDANTGGDNYVSVASSGNDLALYAGAGEKMRIESSGNVGIGTTSPTETLMVSGTGSQYIRLQSTDGSGSGVYFGNNGSSDRRITLDNANLKFENNDGSAEYMRIDSSGNVGINTTNPTQKITLSNGTFQINGSSSFLSNVEIGRVGGDNNMGFATGGTERMRIDTSGNVHITDNSNGPDAALHIEKAAPQIRLQLNGNSGYNTIESVTGNELAFGRSGSERMRIDSSGNLLVGKTATGIATAGIELRADNAAYFTRDSGVPILANRETNNGDIIQLRKDNTTVGSIGTYVNDLFIGTGDAGLWFQDGGNAIRPFRVDTVAGHDNSISLGVASERFKDAHFSGTVNANAFVGDGSALTNLPSSGGTVLFDKKLFGGI